MPGYTLEAEGAEDGNQWDPDIDGRSADDRQEMTAGSFCRCLVAVAVVIILDLADKHVQQCIGTYMRMLVCQQRLTVGEAKDGEYANPLFKHRLTGQR